MGKKDIFAGICILVLLGFSLYAGAVTPTENWYDTVEDWEIEFCSYYGGKEEPISTTGGFSYFMSQLALTLQATKGEVLPDNTQLYEVGYYIQPIQGNVTFRITLFGPYNTRMGVKNSTDVGPGGMAGFETFYVNRSRERYDRAVMHVSGSLDVYGMEGGPIEFEVPIIDRSEEYED
ncbi:hypothetical protein JW968_01965 [Candidatus Woesearchaeota archaeon]|nr:hypothetical protein [Candidatus Woesearchaeota archaeon]